MISEKDFTLENYFKKVTHSTDPDPGNKMVISNGLFVQNAILLILIEHIKVLSGKL